MNLVLPVIAKESDIPITPHLTLPMTVDTESACLLYLDKVRQIDKSIWMSDDGIVYALQPSPHLWKYDDGSRFTVYPSRVYLTAHGAHVTEYDVGCCVNVELLFKACDTLRFDRYLNVINLATNVPLGRAYSEVYADEDDRVFLLDDKTEHLVRELPNRDNPNLIWNGRSLMLVSANKVKVIGKSLCSPLKR